MTLIRTQIIAAAVFALAVPAASSVADAPPPTPTKMICEGVAPGLYAWMPDVHGDPRAVEGAVAGEPCDPRLFPHRKAEETPG
jgi:hypothetical protein